MRRIRPEDWYGARCLDDGVTAICEPHIREFYRCNIWHVRGRGADLLANPTRANTLADPYVTDEIFDALPPRPYCSTCYAVKRAPATRILQDGDVIDLGDRLFEAVHTPGHSPGGIALYESATEILLSGDIVYDGPLIEDTYHSDAADSRASMERLLALPVRLVHGGHFPSFSGDRYRRLIESWLEEKQRP